MMKENQKIARTDLAIELAQPLLSGKIAGRTQGTHSNARSGGNHLRADCLSQSFSATAKALRQIHHHPDPTLVEQPAGPAAGDRRGSRLHPLSAAAGGNGAGGRAGK